MPFVDKVRVYINPTLVKSSKEKVVIWEGCGCVGQVDMFFRPVTRAKEITVEAFDENGKKFQIHTDGIMARVILHELDHLEGIEFVEKVDDYKLLMHEAHYTKQVRNSAAQNKASKVNFLEVKHLD